MNNQNNNANIRLIIISIILFIFFVVIALKLTSIQILNKEKYIKSLDDLTMKQG